MIASGSKTVTAAGKATVKVRLTKAGEKLLRATKKHAKLTLKAVFKDAADTSFSLATSRTVKR